MPAKSVSMRMPYEGPAAGTYGGLDDCADPIRGMGLVCIDIPHNAGTIDLAVGAFCGSASLPVVPGAVAAAVRLDAINGPIACLDAGESATGPATKGIVALRLR